MDMTNITTKSSKIIKFFAIIIFAVIILSCGIFLTGCGEKKDENNTSTETKQEQQQEYETKPPLEGWA
jgi:hypothetical protein